ncbi:hypothetical protein AB656_03640 [Bifidobacterium actinocoloniiforme DSM 22766]|nr:hypothetical protein AB656_03640 [Bifidobacterium actinocoloniiforme DSM 22766]
MLLAFAGVIIVALAVALGLLVGDLRRIVRDLEYINGAATNATVTANTGFGLTRRLVGAVNANLAQTRRLHDQRFNQELRIRRMLTNLTHDIKTPLTVARGYVQLLGERSVGASAGAGGNAGPGPGMAAVADVCHKASSSLDSVDYYLHYLMDFNLIQEKSEGLSLSRVDLSSLVQEDLFAAFDHLTGRGVVVEPDIEPGLRLTSDETLLHRIMQNLIGNWLKYAVRTASVSLRRQGDGCILLRMTNESEQPYVGANQLLKRFGTAEAGRLREDSSGLGLSIVRDLAATVGGRMEVETQPGVFSVSIRLPDQLHPSVTASEASD